MEKGDKVKVLPNKKYGVVDRIEEGFIFLVDDHRPYMRGQLAYVEEEPTPNKMNKHERIDIVKALTELDFICIDVDKKDTYIYKILNQMSEFLDKVEATEKAYEEEKKQHQLALYDKNMMIKAYNEEKVKREVLEKEVNRYWELTHRGKWDNELTDKEKRELAVIKGNLSKVGKE